MKAWLTRFVTWTQAFSIHTKIVGLSLGLVVLMGMSAAWLAQNSFMRSTTAELERRGASIARDVSARGVDMLLTHNVLGLHELLRETMANNEDVRYVIMLDAKGRVAAHTFGKEFPADLLSLPHPQPGARELIQLLRSEEGLIHDVSVTVLDGQAGTVHVGMSPQRIQRAAMTQAQWLMLAVLGVATVATLCAAGLTSILTRPVRELVTVSRAVAAGDLSRRVPPGPPDEIGIMSGSFNYMLAQLQDARRTQTELLDRIIAAQEDERRRIARELHDETSQAITSLIVGLRVLEEQHPEVHGPSENLRQLAASTLDEIHSLILELRPRVLDELGLVAALRRYVADFGHKFGIRAEFQLVGPERRLPSRVETCLYRIVQEALTNVARHSGAATASVVLDLRHGAVSAIVEDDGHGFDQGEVGARSLGLAGMRERAGLVDGTLVIESAPGAGTSIFVKVPE